MTFIVLMMFCGILLNEFVIRPWLKAGREIQRLIDLDTKTEQEIYYNE